MSRADEASAVIDLTSENFDKVLQEHSAILVEFYAPWCGHCKRLAPEYDQAAKELATLEPPLYIAKIDADNEANRPIASRYGIKGFPTLKLFRNGEVSSDFSGDRTAAGIVSYMKKQTSPAVRDVSAEDLSSFSTSDKVVVVGFFNNKDSEEYKEFLALGESLRTRFVFGAVFDAKSAEEHGASVPSVILFKQFDEPKVSLGSDFKTLTTQINTNSVPTIDEIGPENYKTYVDAGLPMVYLFLDSKVEGQKEEYINAFKPIAVQTKGKLSWLWIDWTKYAKHSERLGLSGTKVPALAIDEPQEGLHYAFDETSDLTVNLVESWINKYINKELQPTIKSEEIPANNDQPVKIAVAKNFQSLVIDNDKDVLVEFYAPWCGHCKKLTPIYDELASSLSSIPTISIVKIDATANDVDAKYNVRGFPTLKLFAAGKKQTPIDYEGDRSLVDLTRFLKEKATHSFDIAEPSAVKDEL